MPAGMDYPVDVTEGKSWRKFDPRDQMAFNQEFFSPEAIEYRLSRKLAIKNASDVAREEKLLPLKKKLFRDTELARTAMEGGFAKEVQGMRNIPAMENLKWEKSPQRFAQSLAEISTRNAPAMANLEWEKSPSKLSRDIAIVNLSRTPEYQRNALEREKFDFEKSLASRKPLSEAMADVAGRSPSDSAPTTPAVTANTSQSGRNPTPSWREDPDLAAAFGTGVEEHYKPMPKGKSWLNESQKKALRQSMLLNWPL